RGPATAKPSTSASSPAFTRTARGAEPRAERRLGRPRGRAPFTGAWRPRREAPSVIPAEDEVRQHREGLAVRGPVEDQQVAASPLRILLGEGAGLVEGAALAGQPHDLLAADAVE